MPRYFFHIVDDDGRADDDEGMNLPSLMAVAQEAEASARDILARDPAGDHPVDNRRIEVADETGTVVLVQLLKTLVP